MPHYPIRLLPTVDVEKTETLNQAAISASQLIRFLLDSGGASLIQKLGGWMRWFPNALPSICRALWGWQDTNGNQWLAAGCTNVGSLGGPLLALTPTTSTTITPKVLADNVAVSVTTTTTSNIVTITDTGSNITSFDSVYVQTHIAVGGVIIFGFYACIEASANTYQIALTDQFGNPIIPTGAVTTGGAVENFSTVSGSSVVTVQLPDHGLAVGDDYPVLIQTAIGGVTLRGDYLVQSVVDANNFTILAPQTATSTVSNQAINSGNARYDYYLAFGALPLGTGYGIGGYGTGGYGTGTTPTGNTGNPLVSFDWTLDNWASLLIACPIKTTFGSPDGVTQIGGPIFYWDPLGSTPTATVIPNAPITNTGAFVAMPEQQIVAYGSTATGVQDPLLIRYCDAGNFTIWISTPVNLAGSKRLPRGSRIVSGLQMSQQLVFLTDLSLWTGQFIGGQDVYSWNELADNCGCIAQKAAGILQETLYWMSQSQFFSFSGSGGVQPLPCSVWDVVFQNLNKQFASNIRCATNTYFNEVTWHFPSLASTSGENDTYVKYNIATQGWDYGSLSRSAWIDQTVLGAPIGTDPTTLLIQQHEISNDADGSPLMASFTTGYAVLNEGDVLMFIDQFWPDMKWGQYGSSPNATLMLNFLVAEYPGDTPTVYGPYTLTQAVQYITPRFRGRLVALQFFSQDVGTFWRLGLPRYRAQSDGKFL
jgi:hypothetical protein